MSTFEDIHQFSSRHPSSLWTSISYQTDDNKNLCGRYSAFIRMSISTSQDVHQLSFGRKSVPLCTSISFHRDIQKNLCGCVSAFIWKVMSTSVDIHQFNLDIPHLWGHPSAIKQTSVRTSVTIHQLSTDVHQYLS